MKTQSESDDICCPEFDPVPWDDVIVEWDNKIFLRDSVCTVFFMPLNFGNVMRRLDKKVKDNNAKIPDWLCLSDHVSSWKMDLYLAIDKEIPGASLTTFSGRYYCKVYEGPFGKTGAWCKDFERILKSKGYSLNKMFMWYTTCPKCARKYGKNYVVILSQV